MIQGINVREILLEIIEKGQIKKENMLLIKDKIFEIDEKDVFTNESEINKFAEHFIAGAKTAKLDDVKSMKMLLKIHDIAIRESLKNEIEVAFGKGPVFAGYDKPPAVTTEPQENKKKQSINDFKSYLLFAADKWGTDEEKSVIKNMVDRIKK